MDRILSVGRERPDAAGEVACQRAGVRVGDSARADSDPSISDVARVLVQAQFVFHHSICRRLTRRRFYPDLAVHADSPDFPS